MPELGVFGKIPAKGDFVRHNVIDAAARSFEKWVEQAVVSLEAAKLPQPTETIRLAFCPPGASKAVVGIVAPSHDQVGRKYPLSMFALLGAREIGENFALVPRVWSDFLDAATMLAGRSEDLQWDVLKKSLSSLATPRVEDYELAREGGERTLQRPIVGEFHRRNFNGDGQQFYGYQTFLNAHEQLLADASPEELAILDCPIHVDVDLYVWLELTRRALAQNWTNPSYFWLEDPSPRLLLSFSTAPVEILRCFAPEGGEENRVWPLWTPRTHAIAAAKEGLAGAVDAIESGPSLANLIEVITKRATRKTR